MSVLRSVVDQFTCLCDPITCKNLSDSSGLTSSATPAGLVGSKACCSGETILQEHVEICVLCLEAYPLCKLLNVCVCGCARVLLCSAEIDLDFYPGDI